MTVEIAQLNIPFPFKKYTIQDANAAFLALKEHKGDGKSTTSSFIGIAAFNERAF